jgi:hypothetical protein
VGVLACTSSAQAGEPLEPAFTVVVALLAAAPIGTMMGLKLKERQSAKTARVHLAARTRSGAFRQALAQVGAKVD